ncbi:MAG: hypothetical protein AAFP76_00805 [Bacteroidota bacterium]
MRTTILLLFTGLLLVGCNSVKRNQKLLATGNYDQAIHFAIKKLSKDRNSKKSGEHTLLLEEAYKKVVDRDTRRINFLKKDQNPTSSKEIFYLYKGLQTRQDIIRPLLPLYSDALGRNAKFKMVNYGDKLIEARDKFADDLFAEANQFLSYNTIMDSRAAYVRLDELRKVKANYPNLRSLMDRAQLEGTDFVRVNLNNHSGQIIPARLERELLDFNTYGLDNFWTEYHSEHQQGIQYNFGIALNFRDISVSPERISEREFKRKKRIRDGWEYKLDRNGNVMKDSLGNDIKVDVYKIVTARVMYTTQTKSVLVGGDVVYRDLLNGRKMNDYPLASEFVFENEFAKFRGDERALTEEDLKFLEFDFVPFPSSEQMVFDAGEDIKARLKTILTSNSLR